MILVDSSGLFDAMNETQPGHGAARLALEAEEAPYILSPFVVAELDYLISERVGLKAELAFLAEIAAGRYDLAPFAAGDVAEARDVVARYRDLSIGLADASIVVLAGRYGANRVLTLDERHFRALQAPDGGHFTLLPADA
ncbi:MAG: PIN domain-containing protein [Candidatus Limnocylindria bacterium]